MNKEYPVRLAIRTCIYWARMAKDTGNRELLNNCKRSINFMYPRRNINGYKVQLDV